MRLLTSPVRIKRLIVAAALALAGLAVVGCGSDAGGGAATLNPWVFQPVPAALSAFIRRADRDRGAPAA